MIALRWLAITLRSGVFNLYFFGMTLVLSIGGLGLRLFAPRRALALGQLWARLGIGGARRICGIRLVASGLENLPRSGPALIAAQHQSAFDTMVFLTLLPRPAYVLKRELARIPLFGPLTVLAGMIAIDRAAGAAALRSLLRASDAALSDHRQVVIFPEGTRVDPGEIVALQPGVAAIAARGRLPVIPVVTDSGRRWSRRAFRKYPGPVHLTVLPPIPCDISRAEIMARLAHAFRDGTARLTQDAA